MILACSPDGRRIAAAPGAVATCPACGEPVTPKCGKVVTWHWAHLGRDDCDDWAEPDNAWHRRWQNIVPTDQREVVIGRHRADIRAFDGTVVEIQHSGISTEQIREREAFYGRMAWIFDAVEAYEENRLMLRQRPGRDYLTFRWKHPRKTVGVCRKPVLLDIGHGLLFRVRKIHTGAPCGGWGLLTTHDDIVAWMNSGSRVELFAEIPPERMRPAC